MEEIYLVMQRAEHGENELADCGFFGDYNVAFDKAYKANLESLEEYSEDDPDYVEDLFCRYNVETKNINDAADLFSRMTYPPEYFFSVRTLERDKADTKKKGRCK